VFLKKERKRLKIIEENLLLSKSNRFYSLFTNTV